MKKKLLTLHSFVLALASAGSVLAEVRYVDVNSTNSMPPYTSWATAAQGIQEAINAAVAGDEVVVTNGIYSVGGRSTVDQNTTTNRVVVDKPLALRSVNGPQSTIIDGGGVFRCVYLTSGASLSGFTLTNGFAESGAGVFGGALTNCTLTGNRAFGSSGQSSFIGGIGGGAYGCMLNNCTLSGNSAAGHNPLNLIAGDGGGAAYSTLNNCTLSGNWAEYSIDGAGFFKPGRGGGAYGCTLNNCTLSGNSATYGGGAAGGTLNNCSLTGNSASDGGGALGSTLNNCTLSGNSGGFGGGAAGGTLNNCTLTGNSAGTGGGASGYYAPDGDGGTFLVPVTLNNCTLSGNSARNSGGGAYGGTLNNCIVYDNMSTNGANYFSSIFNYSCTTPQPTNGVGNITNEPAFVNLAAGNYRLRPDSPCNDAGTNLSASITNDLDGRPRPLDGNGDGLAAFDMGAYEYRTPLLVWQDSPNPTPPHADWATAAHTIQDAVDAAVAGDEIVVTNGIYQSGGKAIGGTTNRLAVDKPLTVQSVNGPEVTVIKGVSMIRCVYLATDAILSGFTLTNGVANDGGGVWCDSINSVVTNCVVAGNSAYRGGGAFSGTLINCTLTSNSTYSYSDGGYGGGAHGSALYNCSLTGNSALEAGEVSGVGGSGGGARNSTLSNCTLTANSAVAGGGAEESTLNNCTLTGNSASDYGGGGGAYYCELSHCTLTGNLGGGAVSSTLNNCTLTGNLGLFYYGGGASYSTLNNCTVTGNATWGRGGGAFESTLNNCIVYSNIYSFVIDAHRVDNYQNSILNYCCTTPQPSGGMGNITNAPLFVDLASGNLRLQSISPCINAGLNALAPAGPDLAGNPRIVGGTVDIGAYEFQSPASTISYAWLQQYALPTDGSADTTDPDGDGVSNWQEWHCWTDPTNALSALRLLAPATGGTNLIVTWQSVTGVNYFLERSTAVSSAFTPVTTSIPGQPGTTTYTDTNAIGAGPWFYRVRVIVWPQEQPCLGPSPGPEYICVEGIWTHNGDGRL